MSHVIQSACSGGPGLACILSGRISAFATDDMYASFMRDKHDPASGDVLELYCICKHTVFRVNIIL